ncbi:hypothetical protein SDRG_01833 [Saprolegnia diclina VS20]|uniref:Expansin-like EG45 domain-containing protein n=1 Tax=Saprolegnia diclina (strain VS20) TaxID=1156394 RepID=T0SCZ0_SAPDV|nr:hypothetical protein SDRG_01833 [Saprolegnia diclina VS20]EQC40762.1 hypothetical protein SDRG_01833 [Saprolegnia diclina VS20]|eukprot:XP_008605606.1 hypothetical protein SDRG_01833 [Saprolegnia diclina VS20]
MRGFTLALLCASAASQYTGEGTTYGPPDGGDSAFTGNCALMKPLDFAPKFHAAINDAQWGEGVNCGRCVAVQCTDPRCTSSAQVVGQITDRCPECKFGDLDMSLPMFNSATGLYTDRPKIKWSFVDCPVSGGVQLCAKSGSSKFWLAVQASNAVNGIKSMSINGQAAPLFGGTAYYFKSQVNGVDLSETQITMTSFSGDSITTTVSLEADKCTQISHQFKTGGNDNVAPQPQPSPSPSPKPSPSPQPVPSPSPSAQPLPIPQPSPSPSPQPSPSPSVVPSPQPSTTPSPTSSTPTTTSATPSTTSRVTTTPATTTTSVPSSGSEATESATLAPTTSTSPDATVAPTGESAITRPDTAPTAAPSKSASTQSPSNATEVSNQSSADGPSVGSVIGYGLIGCIVIAGVVVGVVVTKARRKIDEEKENDRLELASSHANIAVL